MFSFIDQVPGMLKAGLFAAVMAFLRVSRDGTEPRLVRRGIESVFCGAITVAAFYGIKALGLDAYEDYGVFAGGCIGMLGSDCVRGLARRFAANKIGGK